jgi:glycosyltransferase involved in cell wall biosynthesis
MASPTAETGDAQALTVVFVGAFQPAAKDGATGGSLVAARSLVRSALAEHVRWVLVDTTGRSVPPPPLPVRALFAARRMVQFTSAVRRTNVDAALIFAGGSYGFVEKGTMALVARAAGKPVLFSPRSGTMIDDVTRSGIQRWFVRAVLSRCDRIICQGETWRRFYQELTGLPDERLVSIPNWIDTTEYAAIRRDPRPERPPTFLYLGWLETYKGVLDLLRAIHLRLEQLAGANVIICGRGSAGAEAQRLTERLGLQSGVSFRGWVLGEEKLSVLADSDVLVLPSHVEGMPNALLEGMAAGLPAIASRVGGIPDVVIDGETGLLFAPGDTDALSRALVRLAHDAAERMRMGRAAQDKIARDHDIRVAWPRMLKAMRSIANGDR